MRSRIEIGVLSVFGLILNVGTAMSQTPDEETPAEEQACDKYLGEGARYGLCVAYCEAQDCDGLKKGDISCENIAQNFIDWSVKKGYAKGPKGVTIDCKATACTPEDRTHCGGVERDCLIDGECTAICIATFLGFDPERGGPICVKAPECKHCVGDVPKIH